MKKLINRLKQLSPTELFLMGCIVLLLILIITRWDWIANEIGKAFSERFSPVK